MKIKYEGTMQFKSIEFNATTQQWNITMTGNEWPWMMKTAKIRCPDCGTAHIRKNGTSHKLKQKYQCLNDACKKHSFDI